MSEDRLERALQQMKEEDVRAGPLEAAQARVWEKVTNPGSATCAEFAAGVSAPFSQPMSLARVARPHLLGGKNPFFGPALSPPGAPRIFGLGPNN